MMSNLYGTELSGEKKKGALRVRARPSDHLPPPPPTSIEHLEGVLRGLQLSIFTRTIQAANNDLGLEFLCNSQSSEMFSEDEKRKIEGQYAGALSHYDTLVTQLPAYSE